MADCNNCSSYLSSEDIIRRSVKCIGGSVAFIGSNVNLSFLSPQTFLVDENQTSVGLVVASLADCTYSIVGGLDFDKFIIDKNTGNLSFNPVKFLSPYFAPDYEFPSDISKSALIDEFGKPILDENGDAILDETNLPPDNIYNVWVKAMNGGLYAIQIINVSIADVSSDIEGLTIGDQMWALVNLNMTITPMGNEIPEVSGNTEWVNCETPAWCHVNGNAANDEIYGKMYNGYAMYLIKEDIETYNAAHPLEPYIGRVPLVSEYLSLATYLGGNSIAGGKMKEAGTIHWGPTNDADNSSGFTALPGGWRLNTNGSFGRFGTWCYLLAYQPPGSSTHTHMVYMSYDNVKFTSESVAINRGSNIRLIIR